MNKLYKTKVGNKMLCSGLFLSLREEPVATFGSSFKRTIGKLYSLLLLAFLGMAFMAGQTYAQTNIYLATAVSGSGNGSSWDNARAGDEYFSSAAFRGVTLVNTHIYIKAGIYSVNNTSYGYMATNSTMQGGFSATATGTDKIGYDPIGNATTINIVGPYFLSGFADASSTVEVKGIRFIGKGDVSGGPVFNGSNGTGSGGAPGLFKATDLYVNNFKGGGSTIITGGSGGSTQTLLTNCVFNDNTSNYGGGAVTAFNSLTITGCSFTNNVATNASSTGGGAVASLSDATFSNSYFCNNTSQSGGALSNGGSNPVIWNITGCTFYNNIVTANYGGAIYLYPGALHISNSNFYNNAAKTGGGAIYKGSNYSTDPTNNITNCIFYGNQVTGAPFNSAEDGYSGGAIMLNKPNVSTPITNCKFVNNSTASIYRQGGAIFLNNFSTTGSNIVGLDGCLFYNNTVAGGSATTNGADFIASNTAYAGAVSYSITNTKVQLSSASSPPYNSYYPGTPSAYNFGSGNTPSNTDNGGVTAFTGSCPANITPVAIKVTGQVWDDVNGNVALDGTETGTNAGGPLYVNLVDGTGTVIASTTVSATGSYTLSAPTNTTGLKLVLTNSATANTPGSLPSQWVNTGESVGAGNPATQSATVGQIELNTGTSSIAAQNFGIEHLPTPGSGANTVPNAGGTTPVTVPANTFTNTAPSTDNGDTPPGSVTAIHLTAFPSNAMSLTINGSVYTAASFPASGVVVPTDGSGAPSVPILVDPTNDTPPASVTFVFKAIDNAGKESTTTGTAVVNFTGVPDLVPIIYARPNNAYGLTPMTVVVDVLELKGVATSGLITVRVTKDPLFSLSFSGSTTSVDGRVVTNAVWSFDDSDPAYYILTTTQVIGAGGTLSFGLSGSLDPSGTSGSVTVSSVIDGGSGGEVKVTNNTDADKIDYF